MLIKARPLHPVNHGYFKNLFLFLFIEFNPIQLYEF